MLKKVGLLERVDSEEFLYADSDLDSVDRSLSRTLVSNPDGSDPCRTGAKPLV